ncbi:hypothetical protein PIB30_098072, partial [Stylosanthes scabra]|nr:hypothetical protein [Stylosanthes scabra]
GNKDKQILSFDLKIEKTLRKLRKQVKLQEHSHEIPFEEALEEEFEDKIGDNMAGNEDKGKSVDPGKSPHIPTTSYTPHPSVLVGSASKASSKDVSNHFFDPP